MAQGFLVSIEAVSFDQTLFDTDDLATIRGASWAAMSIAGAFTGALEKALTGTIVRGGFAGASKAMCRVEGATTAETIRRAVGKIAGGANLPDTLESVAPYLRFAFSVVEEGPGKNAALERQRAIHQFQNMDIDLPEPLEDNERFERISVDGPDGENAPHTVLERIPLDRPCTIDRVRPIERLSWRSDPEGGSPRRDVPVSASVFARKQFGRTGRRPDFYRERAGVELDPSRTADGKGFSLADSFGEIARDQAETRPPPGVPESVFGKICVISMDGNGFSNLREQFISKLGADKGAEEFSGQMEDHRSALLAGIVTYFTALENAQWLQLSSPAKKRLDEDGGSLARALPVLRFETLLWGADESLTVIPGWAYHGFMNRLSSLLGAERTGVVDLAAEKIQLTYGIGVVFCSHKAPIRAVRKLADDLRDNAKGVARRSFETEGRPWQSLVDTIVLGGIDFPMRSIDAERKQLFGFGDVPQDKLFALPLAHMPAILEKFTRMKGTPGDRVDGVARAKLAEILEVPMQGQLTGLSAEEFQRRQKNGEAPESASDLRQLLKTSTWKSPADGAIGDFGEDFLNGEEFSWAKDAPLLPVLHLLQLWNILGIGVKRT